MLKLSAIAGLMLAAALPAAAAGAAVLGPHAAACISGAGPAMLVRVEGLKARTGSLRVQSYGGAPADYFEKGAWLRRVEIKVPSSGAIDVCLPVPAAGTYAVSVRHDVNGSGKADMADGGGMSGNPRLSLTDVLFRRKPKPQTVAIAVGGGVQRVPVVLSYVQGGSFRPVTTAAR